MKRDFYKELENWKNNFIHIPFLVIGARQVGKTYIIDKFCRENFEDYIYINLMNHTKIIEIFEQNINLEDKIKEFQLEIRRPITKQTVIFFDEVQESEELISAMKYFCESEFPYKIILAGSLLGVKVKRFTKSFPVGKVRFGYMQPMSFKEFLIAIGKEKFVELIQTCYDEDKPMNEIFHNELLNDYRNFLCTGGMPEMVKEFVNNNEQLFPYSKNIISSIITSYLSDMKKYTMNVNETVKIERIYTNIPVQLAKENKKYQFSKIEKNARFRDYETSFEWLLSSKLILPCYFVNKFEIPLKAYMDSDNFKIYLNDVGLLTELMDVSYSKIIQDENFMFKGALVENYVATELAKNNLQLYYYQKPQVMEIDFLISTEIGIIPIEVKAGEHVKSTSLNKFMEKQNLHFGIRISTKNFGLENNVKSVPLYAAFCIR